MAALFQIKDHGGGSSVAQVYFLVLGFPSLAAAADRSVISHHSYAAPTIELISDERAEV
jgi:hypothetical protein